ncbi:MAG: hypothetical protein A2896_01040 [Candidatus Nealsonbacteria bacterium RIFCSPLOWO2_01_FULL_43_32]|uniref:PrgI family protein n=1 Tax=Candidatus Nealsonbacteria bacterium RIFCSPLOWO2_01_FULL_43_32 TaxID=1801672 RepID=A0A1G2EFF3_9BACT|nr:MAG: hypothetical protein A2896_01040 [Candidatus Nealsonbacteria bacterium RIFCSPLOWO2_01_FULL_43_32]
MNQFTVPQFIEHEAKIVGPLTFKQFVYVGIAGAICFIFYFTAPFFVFILASIVIMLGGFALAFVKSGGRSLPIVLKNFVFFSLTPKIYLWKKKGGLPPRIIKTEEMPKEIVATPVPKIIGKSRLKNLSTEIDTK